MISSTPTHLKGNPSGLYNTFSGPLALSAIVLTVYFLGCFSGVLFSQVPREMASLMQPTHAGVEYKSATPSVGCTVIENEQQRATAVESKTTSAADQNEATAVIPYPSSGHDQHVVADDYSVAFRESLGFFKDVPSRDWELMREITLARDGPSEYFRNRAQPNKWYQNNWDPDFSCRHLTRIGRGDGAKWICDPLRLAEQNKRWMAQNSMSGGNVDSANVGCLVYSVGSNGNFEFEEGISDMLPGACEIHTFDFNPRYAANVPEGRNIHYHAWGFKPSYEEALGTRDSQYGQVDPSLGEFKTFEETKRALGHEGRPIDIFKIDCEGCEWTTYKDWLMADIRQVLVEVHRAPEVAPYFFSDLRKEGYVTFNKEPNIANTDGNCVEFGFLKLSKAYVEDRLIDSSFRRDVMLRGRA